MQMLQLKTCLQQSDLVAYLCGEIHNKSKTELEEHLWRCDDCFEKLITGLNQHLDQTDPRNDAPPEQPS